MESYDIVSLKVFCQIDVQNAVKKFVSYQEYFDKLNEVVLESEHYLENYTSFTILCNENVRKDFLNELKQIKQTLISLGMNALVPILSELDYEAKNGTMESLASYLTKFHEELASVVNRIASVRVNYIPPRTLEKPIVLAVDDKPELLTATISVLEDRFRGMAVTSGPKALKVIEKHSPALFLLDIEMPEMNGHELAERIRSNQKFKDTPIIFLTSLADQESGSWLWRRA